MAWEYSYLDKNYGGAPDECSYCFTRGIVITLVNGECPECAEYARNNPDGYIRCEPCKETHHTSYRHCKGGSIHAGIQ